MIDKRACREMSTRTAVSTTALLHARPEKLGAIAS
jgi:hypothetical protein